LIPLVVQSVSDSHFKLAISACEVIVPLTWPLEENAENEKDHYLQYKSSCLQKGFWASILKIMMKLIAVPISYIYLIRKRSENDQNRLRLMFCLIRNVLCIEDPKDTIRSSAQSFSIANCHVSSNALIPNRYLLFRSSWFS
jgi:hypothetical protein